MKESMKNIRNAIQLMATEELKRANKEFPAFNSKHEAIGVLDEEVYEMECEIEKMNEANLALHHSVYRDFFMSDKLEELETALTNALAEGIQCIAMCKKFRCYLDESEEM